MPKSKFKTRTVNQIMHENIMERLEKEEQENRRKQLEDEQRQFDYKKRLQDQKFEQEKLLLEHKFNHEKEMSGLVNPIEYLDKVVNEANITSTIRTIGDKKEILISIVLG